MYHAICNPGLSRVFRHDVGAVFQNAINHVLLIIITFSIVTVPSLVLLESCYDIAALLAGASNMASPSMCFCCVS